MKKLHQRALEQFSGVLWAGLYLPRLETWKTEMGTDLSLPYTF